MLQGFPSCPFYGISAHDFARINADIFLAGTSQNCERHVSKQAYAFEQAPYFSNDSAAMQEGQENGPSSTIVERRAIGLLGECILRHFQLPDQSFVRQPLPH